MAFRPARLSLLLALDAVVVAALAAGLAPAAAAQPVFHHVTRAQGLPSDYVNAVYQDRAGFVWLGTDAGLARYDGTRVVTFTADDGLPHPFVYSIVEDGAGMLWVGTYDGLARRVGDRFVRDDGPFARGSIFELRRGGGGGVAVFGVSGVGLRRSDGSGWRLAHLETVSAGTLWGGAALPDGTLVVTTQGTAGEPHLLALRPEGDGFRSTAIPLPAGLGNRPIPRADADGTLLLAGQHGVARVRLRGGRAEVIRRVSLDGVRMIEPDGRGGFYVVQGVPLQVRHLSARLALDPIALFEGQVQALTVDYEDGLWVGAFGTGAARLLGRHLTQVSTYPAARITRGPDGTVWATGDGLLRIDARALTTSPSLQGQPLREVWAGPAGGLWVSRGPDVGPVRSGRAEWRHADAGWISGIDVVGDTTRVSAYGGGLLRFVRGLAADTLTAGRGLPTGMVEGLVRTRSALWAVTRSNGLFRIDGASARRVGREEGLPSSAVYAVYEASDGAVWVGTDRGAGRLASARATRAEAVTAPSLRGQRVSLFFERPSAPGVVWAVGGRRLYRVRGRQLVAVSGAPLVRDGRASINGAVYAPESDRVLLATTGGVVAVDLGVLPLRSAASPRVAWLSVRTDDREMALLAGARGTRLADLPPGRHRVEATFAPLTFSGAARAEVRVDGGVWQDVGDERRVVLAGVGPGDHRVEVRAVSAGGAASDEPARLDLYVRPFWWQRPLLLGALGVLAVGLLAGGVRHLSQRRLRARLGALEREQAAAGRLQRERERISRDLHDHVGAQLSSLLAGVELARLVRRAGGEGPDPLDGVEADARATMRQLRETIWALHQEAVPLASFCDRVRADLAARLAGRDVPVARVACDGEGVLTPIQALNLYRVVQEAVTNALKHAGAETVTVHVRLDAERLAVEVRDDGRFVAPSGRDGLSGFGLRSMEARAAALGGRLEVQTEGGTTVRVVVPTGAGSAHP